MYSYLTNYPRPENYKDSVFYWWFEFLKKSESYKQQCERGEGGSVYQDFGNIFNVEFLDWWNSDDREMIFLPGTSTGVFLVENVKELKEALSENWLVVKIDPKCSRKTISYWLDDMLFSKQPEVRGHEDGGITEQPKYKPFAHTDVKALKKTMAIYEQYLLEPKPLHKIHDKIQGRKDIRKFKTNDEIKKDAATTRGIKTTTISRYLRQAKKIIENVEHGVFPKSY